MSNVLDSPQTPPGPAPLPVSCPAGWHHRRGTLARELLISGRGLHTGRKVTVRILPVSRREAGQGIVFRRFEEGRLLAELPVSPALWRREPLCSTLQAENGIKVRTVEHLLASLLLCQIDDAIVELDAEEVPILDGAAVAWITAIKACGRVSLRKPKRFIRLLRPFRKKFRNPESVYIIRPANDYRLDCSVDVEDFPRSHWAGRLTPGGFAKHLAPARSYGHLRWALPALLAGYFRNTPILRGARIGSVACIAGGHVIGGMNFPEEFARHRALDLIGDFALAGAPLMAKVTVADPTHSRNARVIASLLAKPHLWEWAEFPPPPKAVAGQPELR